MQQRVTFKRSFDKALVEPVLALFSPSSTWYYPVRWSILVLLGLVIYSQTFGFGFFFDDIPNIVMNPYIKKFYGPDYISPALPLTRLTGRYSFALNYALGHLNPMGYHIFNVIVHFLVTGLVWATAGLLIKFGTCGRSDKLPKDLAFIVALLFLVHPCQTQAVSYITQRFESMATLFYLGTVYSYLLARTASSGSRRIGMFILSGLSAILGMITKEVVVTIPLTILAIEFILLPQKDQKDMSSWQKIIRKLGVGWTCVLFAAVVFLFGLLLAKLLRYDMGYFFWLQPSESHDGDVITTGRYLLTEMRVFLTLLRLLVFPINQNFDYDYPLSAGLFQPPLTFVGLCVIGLTVFLVVKWRRSRPIVAFGLSWVLITFSINLVQRANVIYEHKLYLISFGFFLSAVIFLFQSIKQRGIFIGLLIALVIALTVTSFQRNAVWKDSVTLWEDVLKKAKKQRAYAYLGLAYLETNRYRDAVLLLNTAISRKPDDCASYVNRGWAYYRLGQPDAALKDLNRALDMNPDYYLGRLKRALVYQGLGRFKAAFEDVSKAVDMRPEVQNAYVDRGVLYLMQGKVEDALQDFGRALRIAPFDLEALVNRSIVYLSQQRYDLALKDLDQAEHEDPTCVAVYKNRAICLLNMGRVREALRDFQISMRLDPADTRIALQYKQLLHSLDKGGSNTVGKQ
jgi:tetratricopeptide (TPR) repeat protein